MQLIESVVNVLADIIPSLLFTGEFAEESWERLFSTDALSALHPSTVLARHICSGVKEKLNNNLYYDCFVSYILDMNLRQVVDE